MMESRKLKGQVRESELDLKREERWELSRVGFAWQPCGGWLSFKGHQGQLSTQCCLAPARTPPAVGRSPGQLSNGKLIFTVLVFLRNASIPSCICQ